MRILVTGAAGALGQAVVALLEKRGHEVWGVDRAGSEPRGTHPMRVDLMDARATREALATLPVEGVVHCAGGFRWSKLEQITSEDWAFLLGVNLQATFNLLQATAPGMRERRKGSIVVIGAKSALVPGVGMGAYAATKAGVHAMVQSLAEELKDVGVTVNAILPTIMDTPANRREMGEADSARWVSLESVAELALGLLEPKSRDITGALIPISGRI